MTNDATGRAPLSDFYASVLDNAAALVEAHEVQGFDEELALLRLRVRALMAPPGKAAAGAAPGVGAAEAAEAEAGAEVRHRMLLKSIELVVRAVVARYRISPRNAQQLAASIEDVLRRIGDELLPQPVTDV